jgi:3-isopropylmalate/(R)-2-methylmalate dehydratase small subunit
MEKFTRLTGVAAPLPMVNVDTDMVIPKNYLKTTVRTGLGRHLFAEMRYEEDGSERADFVLNKPAYRQANILIAFENFGCGSSREHAPWALLDFGIRCVIAPSFADIFFNNCFKNGILPLVLPKAICEQLIADAERGANATLTVDLDAEELIRSDGERIAFAVEPFRRHRLLQGLDEIGATMARASSIDVFEDRLAAHQPWRASVLGQ